MSALLPTCCNRWGVFITKDAHQEYVHETFPFQQVDCEVNTFAIRQCSFSLSFRFYVGGKLVSKGYQQIVFANQEKKIARLPEAILEKIREYENPQQAHQSANESKLVLDHIAL